MTFSRIRHRVGDLLRDGKRCPLVLLLFATLACLLLTRSGSIYQSLLINQAGAETSKNYGIIMQDSMVPTWRGIASRFPQNEAVERNLRRQWVLEGNLGEAGHLSVPRDPFGAFWTGYGLLQLGECERSIMVMEDLPGVGLFFVGKGRMLAEAGLWKEAILWLEVAARLEPDVGDQHCRLARAYRSMGSLSSALLEARRAVQSAMFVEDSLRFSCALMAGRLLMDQKQLEEAADYLELAASLRPDHVQPPIELGRLQLLVGREAQARSYYQCALDLDPTNVDALVGLGDAYRQAGSLQIAVLPYLSARVLKPNDGGVRGRLSRLSSELIKLSTPER